MSSCTDDPKKEQPDLHADAWQRFERAVDVVAKSSPQPRTKPTTVDDTRQPKKRRKQKSSAR
jgi:hypothetical protein